MMKKAMVVIYERQGQGITEVIVPPFALNHLKRSNYGSRCLSKGKLWTFREGVEYAC